MILDKKKDLISIVMPVRNAMPFLVECMDSILSQTFDNWELIAVDNQSNDRSLQVLEDYALKDRRIKVLRNTGVPKIIEALNLAYSHASGYYITRMDADDIMVENKLEELKKVLDESPTNTVATGKVNYFSIGEIGEGFIKYEKWLNEMAHWGTYYDHIYKECVYQAPVG